MNTPTTPTVDDMYTALQYNADHGLYANHADCLRIYATYDGGKYNGQRTSLKSTIMLDRELEAGEKFKDIEIISTSDAWRAWTPKEAK